MEALDDDGDLYVGDRRNHQVRRIDPSGAVTTVAGSGRAASDGDGGPAVRAVLDKPKSVGVDSSGNLYLADSGNFRVRRIGLTGTITVVAQATVVPAGLLGESKGVAVDSAGRVYVANQDNSRVLRIEESGAITATVGSRS